jgi:superfamily II DNA or RNA helicase
LINYKNAYFELLAENSALKTEIEFLKTQLAEVQINEDTPAFYKHIARGYIQNTSSAELKITFFKELFYGRNDVYAKQYINNGKLEYFPACKNILKSGICKKPEIKCDICKNRILEPLNDELIEKHLRSLDINGADAIGIYPLLTNNTVRLLVIDFDGRDVQEWKSDVFSFRQSCKDLKIHTAIERSSSGNGAHAWFFFAEPISSVIAQCFGNTLISYAMEKNHQISFKIYDRLCPDQDIVPENKLANSIALPLQGAARKKNNSVFIDENFIPYEDQWAYLSELTRITKEQVDNIIRKFNYYSEFGALYEYDNANSFERVPNTSRLTAPLSKKNFPAKVQIVKLNMLHIEKTNMSEKALNNIKRLAVFKNPVFYEARLNRLSVYGIPRIISISEENKQYLSIPRGLETKLKQLLDNSKVNYTIHDNTNPGVAIDVVFNDELNDNQKKAADTLLSFNYGILQISNDFGKTTIISYIIEKLKINTLILVHTEALLNQWKAVIMPFLNKNESEIGHIDADKNVKTGVIDIALIQLFVNDNEKKKELRNYGLVIVDECQCISALTIDLILKNITARYVYGLSSLNQNEAHPITIMQFGNIRFSTKMLIEPGKQPFVYIIPHLTHFKLSSDKDKTDEKQVSIAKIYELLSSDNERNMLIVNDIIKALNKGRVSLVLIKKHEQLTSVLHELKKKSKNIFLFTKKLSQKEMHKTVEELYSIKTESFVVVADIKFIETAFDIPRLDTIFLASPVSSRCTLQQYIEKLQLKSKRAILVYDYIDIHVRLLNFIYCKRLYAYSKMGCKVLPFSDKLFDTKLEPNLIYDAANYMSDFENDLKSAKKEIIIASPYLNRIFVQNMLQLFNTLANRGINITIITQSLQRNRYNLGSSSQQLLRNSGVNVIEKENFFLNFAIIDKMLVWYGNINFIGNPKEYENVIRFMSEEAVSELYSFAKWERINSLFY